ncbi:hypothetical protein FACS1894205_3140 [Alphaproteobacteria bacterium]|nr:hypothetical protein FACS1894205_3140 [Alphaproteobacteria bacterium]
MYAIHTEPEDDALLIFCRDLPMLVSFTFDESQTLKIAQGALVAILSSMIDEGMDIPNATPPQEGEILVPLPTRVVQKLRIYQAMRNRGWRPADLARAMRVSHLSATRLLDPCHASTHDSVDQAIWALGMASEVSFLPNAGAVSLVKNAAA